MGNNNNFFPSYAPYGYDQIQTIDGQCFPPEAQSLRWKQPFETKHVPKMHTYMNDS